MLAQLGRLERRPILVWLEVPRDELLRRLRHRREVEGRVDDVEEAMARRLELHDAQAGPLLDALEGWVDVLSIDGGRPPDVVTEEIMDRLLARPGADHGLRAAKTTGSGHAR